MDQLFLDSLEIHNFRGFQHLQIEKLGRVNLIVGRNNIGKSALLEALQLYAQPGNPNLIWTLLRGRDELKTPLTRIDTEEVLIALKYLFFGRNTIQSNSKVIQIGPIDTPEKILTLSIEWTKVEQATLFDSSNEQLPLVPRFHFRLGERLRIYPLLPNQVVRWSFPDKEMVTVPSIFISANGLDRGAVASLWDEIALTSFEKEVISALSILAPGIAGINFIGDVSLSNVRASARESSRRIPIVKIVGMDEPLPIRTLGNGMQRLLDLILALVCSKNGVLLIDEIENGIHYSAQKELWQVIFRLARRLNIQVFATTHSWDCIEGFQKVAIEHKQEEAMLVRLSLKKDGVLKTVLYDERRLEIATREQIEVR